LIPQIGVGYAGARFGGGINGDPELFNSRGDGTAMMTWQLNGMGVEDWARAKVRRTQMNEATIHVREIQARVAAEVTAAAKVAREHKNALASAQEAVRQAEEMWVRLEKGVFHNVKGVYDPLEPLTAEQALDAARTEYLKEVIEFNRSQFQLYWAMGQPPQCALPQVAALPVEVPAVPGPRTIPSPPPAPARVEGPAK
jgi:outer membrane protein TolC